MNVVLVVEGHRMMRGALLDLLVQNGFQSVIGANDPIDAIGKTSRLAPRVIILDTAWQEIQGVYLSRILRELDPQSHIVLLVDEEWNAEQEMKDSSGADTHVPKSMLLEKLPPLLLGWERVNVKSFEIG